MRQLGELEMTTDHFGKTSGELESVATELDSPLNLGLTSQEAFHSKSASVTDSFTYETGLIPVNRVIEVPHDTVIRHNPAHIDYLSMSRRQRRRAVAPPREVLEIVTRPAVVTYYEQIGQTDGFNPNEEARKLSLRDRARTDSEAYQELLDMGAQFDKSAGSIIRFS